MKKKRKNNHRSYFSFDPFGFGGDPVLCHRDSGDPYPYVGLFHYRE